MRILITGASGFVGWNAVRYFAERGHDVVGTYRSLPHYLHQDDCRAVELDLADSLAIDEVVARFQPDFILHAAALARPQIDGDALQLDRINVDATAHLARTAAALDIPLVYISTDLVYPPDAGRCDETTPVAPSGAGRYSLTKLLGEEQVRAAGGRSAVIRATLMFGNGTPRSNSFSQFLERKWAAGEAAPVFTDQIRSFLFVRDLCSAVDVVAAREEAWGELFVCGGEEAISRAEFALRYAAAVGVDPSLCDTMRAVDLPGYVGGSSTIAVDGGRLRALGWRPTPLADSFAIMIAERRPDRFGQVS